MERKTPWPIELEEHPLGTRQRTKRKAVTTDRRAAVDTTNVSPFDTLASETREDERIAETCFRHPEHYRDQVLEHVRVAHDERFEGRSIYYLWLNKVCPVGCEHCFFESPSGIKSTAENEITDDGIDRIVEFSEDSAIKEFTITGGGEPMMSRGKVYELVKRAKSETIVLVTSSYWSKNADKANEILTTLLKCQQENPNQPETIVRISLDVEHFDNLSRGRGFGYLQNVVNWFQQNTANNPKFKLLFHSLQGDPTTEQLLETLPVAGRKQKGRELEPETEVTLDSGLVFDVEYSQSFDADPNMDLHDRPRIQRNVQTFQDFVAKRRNGNIAVVSNGPHAKKGVDYLTFYDGTLEIWGASAPDAETSIYTDDYDETMTKSLNDIITLANLEKGTTHLLDLVNEVNPKAAERAQAIGLRDFFMRLLMEEDTTRLYVSVRLMQEYIAEGKINETQINAWPSELRDLARMDTAVLQKACVESPYTIVQQYLADPELTVEKLLALRKRVALGHYAVTVEQMHREIMASTIDPSLKVAFEKGVEEGEPAQLVPLKKKKSARSSAQV